MDEPKEFWIAKSAIAYRDPAGKYLVHENKKYFDAEKSAYNVIEKSAYDRAKEISRNLEHSVARLEKQIKILRAALEHCRDFDTSAKFGYEYGQKVRGHIPEPGTRFKTPKEMAQQALADAEDVE